MASPVAAQGGTGNEGAQSKPKFWRNKYAFRAAINANPVLGLLPKVRKSKQPTQGERWWLFFLYMVTGLFLEHLSLLYGPICRSAYVEQCHEDAWENQSASLHSSTRRLLADEKAIEGATSAVLSQMHGATTELNSTVRSSRDAIIGVLSGHIKLNCKLTKCDHWEHLQLDHSKDKRLQYYTVLYVPGMCRCNHTMLQKVTFQVAVAVASVFFQTVLFKIFHAIMARDWESVSGVRRGINGCFKCLLDIVLFTECAAIWLIKFQISAWIISLSVSAASVMTLSFGMAYASAHLGLSKIHPELFDESEKEEQAQALLEMESQQGE